MGIGIKGGFARKSYEEMEDERSTSEDERNATRGDRQQRLDANNVVRNVNNANNVDVHNVADMNVDNNANNVNVGNDNYVNYVRGNFNDEDKIRTHSNHCFTSKLPPTSSFFPSHNNKSKPVVSGMSHAVNARSLTNNNNENYKGINNNNNHSNNGEDAGSTSSTVDSTSTSKELLEIRNSVATMRSNSLVHVHIRDFESRGGVSNTYKQTGAALRRYGCCCLC